MNDVTQQKRPHPVVTFKKDLEAFISRELEAMDDKARGRLKSAAITAISKDPDLILADRQSFMAELRRCASYGVLPDGVQAVLQVYNTKIKDSAGKEQWIKKVTLLPMIRGILERVQRSGKVKLFYAEVVYANEQFAIDTTHGDRRARHDFDPMRRGPDADIIGAYSVALYKDGTTDCEPMPRADIEKVRAVAKTKNVWEGWFSEKAKVAVMKRHAKRLPLSADDIEFIMNRDETDFSSDAPRDVTPKANEPRKTLAQQFSDPDPVPMDGEIMEDEVDQRQPDPSTLEYAEGRTAGGADKPLKECPYDLGTEEWMNWAAGHAVGKAEDEQ